MARKTGAQEFLDSENVSRETFARLRTFAGLLEKWNRAARLVSASSLGQLWTRHILDSSQILDHAPAGMRKWLDIGTGGGFPGLVLAIIAAERQPDATFILVDSNRRKCEFLQEACRQTGIEAEIMNCRAEQLAPQDANVVSARAVAPLDRLLGLAQRHLAEDGICVFPKGASYQDELDAARRRWRFGLEILPSRSDERGRILLIRDPADG